MRAHIQAIEILMNGTPNFRDISIAFAKEYPELFVELATKIRSMPDWVKDVVSFLKEKNLVQAIKLTRSATGFGLKEAKDICDNVAYSLRLREQTPTPLTNSEMSAVYHQILDYARTQG